MAFLGALLCKEAAVALPAVLLLLDWLTTRRLPRPWATRYLAFAAALFVYIALRLILFAPPGDVARSFNNNPLVDEGAPVRLLTALRLLAETLRVLLLPITLSADYSYAQILPERSPASGLVVAGALVLVAIIAGAIALRRRAPAVSAGAVLFLVPWLVVSNIPFAIPTIFAERLLYAPAAGVALALAALVVALHARGLKLVAVALAVILVGGNLARTVARDREWRDEVTLFAAAVEATPRSARSWNNLGAALLRAGRPEEALEALRVAVEIAPQWSAPHALAGAILDQAGDAPHAEQALRRAVQLDPDHPDAVHNLAVFLARRGRLPEAAALLERFLQRRPQSDKVRALLTKIRSDLARAPR
jgi:protein O-mannosyl-transferase